MIRSKGPLLKVRDLTVSFPTEGGLVRAVDHVSFDVERGQTLGVVGESGSGKSATFLAVMSLLDPTEAIVTGEVLFDGVDLLQLTEKQLRSYRARRIGMIFQDSLTGLNPVHRVGDQIAEVALAHSPASPWSPAARRRANSAARHDALAMLHSVGVSGPERRARQWPHEFSGGMRQRAMIAMALMLSPDLLIADEPTTALDVTVQAQILELIAAMQARTGAAVVLITHDLGVVAEQSDHVMVMYAGRSAEYAARDSLFKAARHPYTKALLQSVARIDKPKPPRLEAIGGQPPSLVSLPPGCPFHLRCPSAMPVCRTVAPPLRHADPAHAYACHLEDDQPPGNASDRAATAPSAVTHPVASGDAVTAAPTPGLPGHDQPAATASLPEPGEKAVPLLALHAVTKYFPIQGSASRPSRREIVRALDGVDLEIAAGETLGLVGESGCGKSTLARVAARLHEPTTGSVEFDGKPLADLGRRDGHAFHADVQMVFQDPYASLNPRKTVGSIIAEPLRIHRAVPRGQLKQAVRELMEIVGLNPEHYSRYPHAFSGGQRQRVGIARALALRPRMLVADEPVSALDVSIQAQVINLLIDLQREFSLTYLFIAHDLTVVRQISDRVVVMYLGRIVEDQRADQLFARPAHPYTQALLSAAPIPEPAAAGQRERIVLSGDMPSPTAPPTGCRFHTRCPRARFPRCAAEDPPLRRLPGGALVACHYPLTN